MDRDTLWVIAHRVTKSWTQLSNWKDRYNHINLLVVGLNSSRETSNRMCKYTHRERDKQKEIDWVTDKQGQRERERQRQTKRQRETERLIAKIDSYGCGAGKIQCCSMRLKAFQRCNAFFLRGPRSLLLRLSPDWMDTFAIWCEELTHWTKPWCLERLKAGGEGTAEDEMAGWHQWLDGLEFEQVLGAGDGQGSLACCSPWVGHNWVTDLDWTDWMRSLHTVEGSLLYSEPTSLNLIMV